MAYWSRQTIRERISEGIQLVDPFDDKRLAHSAYEMALGKEAFLTSFRLRKRRTLNIGNQIAIPSGEFAILLTEEIVSIPSDAIGFISIKYGIKSRGLINVSGFHVDPGYRGHLKFAVYNSGPQSVCLERGQPLFLIWFASLDHQSDKPYPNSPPKDRISTEDVMRLYGTVESPPAIAKKLGRISVEVRVIEGLLLALLAGVAAILTKVISP